MKKLLLSLLLTLSIGIISVSAAETDYNFTVTGISSSKVATLSWTPSSPGSITLTAQSSTAPAFNSNGKDLRIYANGSLTVTVPTDITITKIVFNLSSQGKSRLPEISASVGSIATQAKGDATVTWSGSVTGSDIKLTWGAKATYGNKATDAAQFCFSAGVVTVESDQKPKTSVSLAWDPTESTINLGDDFSAPTFSATVEGTANAEALAAVTYTSDNEGLLNYVDGKWNFMPNVTGTATITASIPSDNETYSSNEAKYTLTVTPKPVLGKITVNGTEVGESFTCIEGTPVVFAADNAETISVKVVDESTSTTAFEVIDAAAPATWESPAIGNYNATVTVNGCDDTKTAQFAISVTEKPAEPTALYWNFGGYSGNPTTTDGLTLTNKNDVVGNWVVKGSFAGDSSFSNWGVTKENPRVNFGKSNSAFSGTYSLTNSTIPEDATITEIIIGISGTSDATVVNIKATVNGVDATGTATWSNCRNDQANYKSINVNLTGNEISFSTFDGTNGFGIYDVEVKYIIPKKIDAPAIMIDGDVVTDFETDIDLKKGAKTVTITAADESHHIYYKHEGSESISVLAETTDDGFNHILSNTHTFDINTNGTLSFYAQHPVSGARSDVKTLTFVGDSTAIFEVEAADGGEAEWFDLTGRRVAKPAKGGVYIIKEGSKTSKRAF